MSAITDGIARAASSSSVLTSVVVLVVFMLVLAPSLQAAEPSSEDPAPTRHVILVSVDGLRSDAVTRFSADVLPTFYRLRAEASYTDNARTDADYTVTLPNHVAQLTGRPVRGDAGHNWTSNSDPGDGMTLHSRKGRYVPSVFDVVSDHGHSTGVYASKSKFVLLDQSYDAINGAPDKTGPYDGRDKIDTFVYESDTDDLVQRFLRDMNDDPHTFSFVHLRDPDSRGHFWTWAVERGSRYMSGVRKADRLIGQILDLVERDPHLAGRTTLIVTSDHGGSGRHHDARDPEHFTVPFYVWGPDVSAGDLYEMNAQTRQDPGTGHPGYDAELQPVRNADAANLALSLLGLDAVPGSTVNEGGELHVQDASTAERAVESTDVTG